MWKKVWHFIWYDDSLASWLVNLVLAFVLVKWVIYPGIGLLFGTSYPIVAVVSGSMEHRGLSFDAWWNHSQSQYSPYSLSPAQFTMFPFKNGFNKGDIMVLRGIAPKAIKRGDVVVYESSQYNNPIIHRVVQIRDEEGHYTFVTKGDNNIAADGSPVTEEQIQRTGKAIFRIPYLGWVKIWFVMLLGVH